MSLRTRLERLEALIPPPVREEMTEQAWAARIRALAAKVRAHQAVLTPEERARLQARPRDPADEELRARLRALDERIGPQADRAVGTGLSPPGTDRFGDGAVVHLQAAELAELDLLWSCCPATLKVDSLPWSVRVMLLEAVRKQQEATGQAGQRPNLASLDVPADLKALIADATRTGVWHGEPAPAQP